VSAERCVEGRRRVVYIMRAVVIGCLLERVVAFGLFASVSLIIYFACSFLNDCIILQAGICCCNLECCFKIGAPCLTPLGCLGINCENNGCALINGQCQGKWSLLLPISLSFYGLLFPMDKFSLAS
jgi:hypothetical protein